MAHERPQARAWGKTLTGSEKSTNGKKKVFVISPIGAEGSDIRAHANLFLSHIVRVALPDDEYEVRRADEDDSPYAITEAMLGRILEADICVADITGMNPNVMYELALAHAADKHVIVMTSDDSPSPFDIKDFRKIKYGLRVDMAKAAVQQLRDKATHSRSETAFEAMLNPVATAFREWTDRQRIHAENDGADQAILRVIDRLDQKVDRLAAASRPAPERLEGSALRMTQEDALNMVEHYLSQLEEMREEMSRSTSPTLRATYEMLIRDGKSLHKRLRHNMPVEENLFDSWAQLALQVVVGDHR